MTEGTGITIAFHEDWFSQIMEGKPGGKKKLADALKEGMKKASKEMQKDFVSKLYSGKLKRRSGDLEKSFMVPGALAVTGTLTSGIKVHFGSDNKYAWALEKGATIRPTAGKWLAWPSSLAKRKQFRGDPRPARKFFQTHGKRAVFKAPGEKGKYGGIFLKIGKNRLQKWFHVAKSTKVPKRLHFESRTNSFWETKGMAIVEEAMVKRLGIK